MFPAAIIPAALQMAAPAAAKAGFLSKLGAAATAGITGGVSAGISNRVGQLLGGDPTPYLSATPHSFLANRQQQLSEQAQQAGYQMQSRSLAAAEQGRQADNFARYDMMKGLNQQQFQQQASLEILRSNLRRQEWLSQYALSQAGKDSIFQTMNKALMGTDNYGQARRWFSDDNPMSGAWKTLAY